MKRVGAARASAKKLSWMLILGSALTVSCSNQNFGGNTPDKVDNQTPAVGINNIPFTRGDGSQVDPSKPNDPNAAQPNPVAVNNPAPTSNPTPVTRVADPIVVPVPVVPPTASAMVRVPVLGFVNMASAYQITNEGYRVSVQDNSGKVLASGPLTVEAVMDGQSFDARSNGWVKPYLLGVKPKYLAPEILNGSLQGEQKAKVSICMAKDRNASYSAPIECTNLNGKLGHANGANTFINLPADIVINKDQVGIRSLKSSTNSGDCGSSEFPCAAVMHPMYGFAAKSAAFRYDNASPLVLDLDHNGKLDLISAWRQEGPVSFDIAGNNNKVRMGWVSGKDGFLALDINANGKIDSGRELFGEHSHSLSKSARFNNGYLALGQYDENKDGMISAKDSSYSKLVVWQDRNSDGISQKDELKSLASAGVIELPLKYETVSSPNKLNLVEGNDVRLMGGYKAADGKTYKMADVWFELRLHKSLAQILSKN